MKQPQTETPSGEAVVTHNIPLPYTNGTNGTSGVNGATKSNLVPVGKKPVFTPRKLRVVCVGAGYSGLILAYKHAHQMKSTEIIDLTIYEKNHDVGGTWLENRYPGIACDVPAHVYTFSWEPNPDWTTFYAKGPEIWEYIKRTTTKYNLDDCIEFGSRVVESIWSEGTSTWKIKIEQRGRVIEDEADVLINGSGILNKWKWPVIEGFKDYKGTVIHSAAWDESLDWAGKRVAVIGNGSSAIQIVPKIQAAAKHLTNYIRSPTWISSNFNQDLAPKGGKFTEAERQRFHDHPEELTAYRKKIEHDFNSNFPTFLSGTVQQEAVYGIFTQLMKDRLGNDEELCSKLIPKWQVGCRRLTPGDGYLEALREPNVKCGFSPIIRLTEKGILTEDGEEEFDIIICATGFDVSFCPFWKLVGRDGRMLAEEWAESPEAYFGICAAGVPNYFIFNGPNCPVGHGSLLAVMEWTAEYIIRWCEKIATHDIRSIAVKDEVIDDFNVYAQEFLKGTVWASGCRSWYKNGKVDGKVTAMYSGSVLHYKEILEKDRGEDFDIRYNSKNRFSFMGNGFTRREEKGDDLSFYLVK